MLQTLNAPVPSDRAQAIGGMILEAAAVDVSGGDVTLEKVSVGLYVGVTGNVKVRLAGQGSEESVLLGNLAAGVFHPLAVTKIFQSTTTATGIIVGY